MYRVESYESTCSATSSQLLDQQESKETFESAETIADLQRLTAAFLRGELSATSYHFGPLLPESASIVEKLVEINQLGLITTSSQPGRLGPTGKQRCYVEGVLPKRFFHLFSRNLYRIAGEGAFITTTDTEMSYEEMVHLKHCDLYWVTKDIDGIGVTHISESTGPCGAFQTCREVWPQLVDEYVGIFVMDTVWGRPDWLLSRVAEVLRFLRQESLVAERRVSARRT